jgi:hypothetical protein
MVARRYWSDSLQPSYLGESRAFAHELADSLGCAGFKRALAVRKKAIRLGLAVR